MSMIVPAALFQGRFTGKDLKALYESIGYYTEKTKNFETLQALLLDAWRDFDGVITYSGVTGTLYSAPNIGSLREYLRSPERKSENQGDRLRDVESLSRVENFFTSHCLNLENSLRDFALRFALESGRPELLAQGIEDQIRYSYFRRGIHRFAKDVPTFMVIESPVLERRIGGSWINDHNVYLASVIDAYACGRPDLALRFFRRSDGLSNVDSDCRQHATNLCMAVMYNDSAWKEQALQGTAVYLKKTKAVYERAFVEFFAGVLLHDADLISSTFTLLAQNSPKLMWLRDLNNKKIFCSALHGLYAFAHIHASAEACERLERPHEAWWWNEFADLPALRECSREYQREYLGPLFPFSEELSFLNEVPLLIEPSRGETCVPLTDTGTCGALEEACQAAAPGKETTAGAGGVFSRLRNLFR